MSDTSSALLRHEIAYVMGQMQLGVGLEYLVESLTRKDEHSMVRHEAAEALGAIEERWEEAEVVLRGFRDDEEEDVIVRESAEVALDSADYFGFNQTAEATKTTTTTTTTFKKTKEMISNGHFNVKV